MFQPQRETTQRPYSTCWPTPSPSPSLSPSPGPTPGVLPQLLAALPLHLRTLALPAGDAAGGWSVRAGPPPESWAVAAASVPPPVACGGESPELWRMARTLTLTLALALTLTPTLTLTLTLTQVAPTPSTTAPPPACAPRSSPADISACCTSQACNPSYHFHLASGDLRLLHLAGLQP